MNTTAAAVPAMAGVGGWLGGGASSCRSLFTASQWQELEHQALIFKYMAAGVPVPPDLVRNALCAAAADPTNIAASRFYLPTANGSSVAYSLYGIGGGSYGKKLDPEPGRCRRTDGKKWRCSKDAHPDSKYCERHMNRGRNRSRKPVESQSQLPLNPHHHNVTPASSPSTSSTITSLTPNAGCGVGSSQSGMVPRNHPFVYGGGVSSTVGNPASTQLLLDSASYLGMGSNSKDNGRYLNGPKSDYYSNLYPSASGNARTLGVSSTVENPWPMLQSGASYSFSDDRNRPIMPSSYNQLHSANNLGQESISSFSKQQHCFFGSQYGSSEGIKQEGHSLRPFFEELPKARDSWAELGNERSNRTSFSTTQLSISIPMTSSDFSTTSSTSPNDD